MRAYLIERGALPEIDAFVNAVEAGDAAAVRALLVNTPPLRAHIDRPLFHFGGLAILAAKNNRPLIEVLLEFGANINARSHWWAGGFGVLDGTDPGQAAWLIERGAIVDIHAAAGLGRSDIVTAWLEKDPALVNAPGGDGQRPLHVASSIEIIDLLLDHGAEIDARDVDHQATAAQYRVRDTELCRHLIARGAAVDIFMAAALGDPVLVERVLAADPDSITARIGRSGYAPVPAHNHIYNWKLASAPTVLLVAAKYGGAGVYDLLFSRSPAKQRFLAACMLGDETAAREALAARQTLLTELSNDDCGQLAEAAFNNNLPALTVMLTLGFDVNAPGGEGFTPVNHAALRGLAGIVRLLIEHGADPEVRNQYGGTALESCQWGSLNFRDPDGDYAACAEALLRGGAVLANPDFGSGAVQAVLRRHAGGN
jgi:ankyrin repeat protein